MQVVAKPFPGLDLFDCETWLAICERREEEEAPESGSKNDASGNPASKLAGSGDTLANRARAGSTVTLLGRSPWGLRVLGFDAEDKLDKGTSDQTRSKVGWEVVVQEQLTTHDVEGDVVSSPGEEEETGRVIETRAGAVVESIHATAQSQLISTDDTGENGKE
jgi:hypothetical protein